MEVKDRIKMIIESHRLTAGAFADKIGVQRSNVSHVLGGRNKPSFEFLEKIVLAFPRVSALWLLTGKQGNEAVSEPKQGLVKTVSVNPEIADSKKERKLVKTILIYSDQSCEEFTVNQQ
jgi:transcriptional regulator with XRE-family HTH domain